MKLQIQKLSKEIDLPSYSKKGDAGLDLRSSENKIIKPQEKEIISTGIKVAIPENHVGLIWDRSGLASNNELHVLAGVVDSNYRGEIKIVIKNLSKKPFQVEKNMRIAQLLIQPVLTTKIEEVLNLETTNRNEQGFGSTGLN